MPTFASPWLLGLRSMFKSGVLHGVRKIENDGYREAPTVDDVSGVRG